MWTTCAAVLALFSVSSACVSERARTQRAQELERSSGEAVEAGVELVKPKAGLHLTPKDRIGDVLQHPAFQGYASLLLPWDDRSYDEKLPLAEIDVLLPYHSHVRGELAKPAAVIMAYTGHSDRAKDEPPTFVVVGENDAIAPPAVMARRVGALSAAGTPTEFRRYPNVGHGFGSGVGTSAEGWLEDALRFWERFLSLTEGDRKSTHGDARP